MSQISENRWQLEREREIREAARKAREAEISQTTEIYLRRYEQQLNDLENSDLAEFALQNIATIRTEIQRVRHMNAYDGRNRSFAIGQLVQAIRYEAQENKRVAEEHQHLLREEAERAAERLRAEIKNVWIQETSNWENKQARNLAFKPLAILRKRITEENLSIADIKSAIHEIKQSAEQQAEEIRKNFAKTVQDEVAQTQKSDLLRFIETANLPQSESERLKQKIEQENQKDLTEIIQEAHQIEDTVIEKEAVRKEMVKAVYQSLKQAGFTVLNPIKQGVGEDSVVVIQASRPQGNRAKFRVRLDGAVRYEFDNYKGQRCKEDMQKVLPKLSEVYGVNLSDERVLWENPDDEHADAKPINPTHTAKSH